MSIATFQGTVENGQVHLAADIRLPEKAIVYIVVPNFEQNASGKKFNLVERPTYFDE